MYLIKQAMAASDVNISGLYNPAPKIPLTSNISTLLTGAGFNLLNLVFTIIGIALFANLIIAGWDYMMSSGDPKKVTAANSRLTNGLVGVIMAVTAFLVVRLVSNLLNLNAVNTPII